MELEMPEQSMTFEEFEALPLGTMVAGYSEGVAAVRVNRPGWRLPPWEVTGQEHEWSGGRLFVSVPDLTVVHLP